MEGQGLEENQNVRPMSEVVGCTTFIPNQQQRSQGTGILVMDGFWSPTVVVFNNHPESQYVESQNNFVQNSISAPPIQVFINNPSGVSVNGSVDVEPSHGNEESNLYKIPGALPIEGKVLSNTELLDLCVHQYEIGNYETSRRFCEELLTRDPMNFSVMLVLGSIYLHSGDFESAAIFSAKAIRLNPLMVEAYCNLGQAFKKQGRVEDAKDCFRRAAKLQPGFLDAYINLLSIAYEENNVGEVVQTFVDAVQRNPDNHYLRNNFGNALMNLGRTEEAKACYMKAIEIKPDFAEAWNGLGLYFLFHKKEIWLAFHHFEKAISFQPNYAEALINFGNALSYNNIFERATEVYVRALTITPENSAVQYKLGRCYSALGLADFAIERYVVAVGLQENFPDAYFHLGLAYQCKGLLKEAEDHYNTVIKLDPSHANAIDRLGTVKIEQGFHEEAISLFTRALELQPLHDMAQANLTAVLQQKQQLSGE